VKIGETWQAAVLEIAAGLFRGQVMARHLLYFRLIRVRNGFTSFAQQVAHLSYARSVISGVSAHGTQTDDQIILLARIAT
jgi:hypothetical protein